MNSLTVRKHISLKEDEYELINNNAKLLGISFSEFLKKSALLFIEEQEKANLAEFLNSHCKYVSKEEQKEIEALNIDYDDLNGEEIDINELL